jgi:hypothetical protein
MTTPTPCTGSRILDALRGVGINPDVISLAALPLPQKMFFLRLAGHRWPLPLGSSVYRSGSRSRYVVRPDGTYWRYTASRPKPTRLADRAAVVAQNAIRAGRWPETPA